MYICLSLFLGFYEIEMEKISGVFCWLLLISSGICLVHGACDTVQADVIFLIDASGSVRLENFKKQLGFAADFSTAFDIGPSALQVGVITFSDKVTEQFNLQAHSDKADLTSAIKAIIYTMGSTFTDRGLEYIRHNGFTSAAGDRPGAPNIVILLTDGKSNEPLRTKEQAELLRNTGVEIYAIGIGSGINSTELDTVATNHRHVFMVENFDRLAGFITTIKDSLCQNLDPCSVYECHHGGTCQKNNGATTCQCATGYTGEHCDTAIDPCSGFECRNSGTCQTTNGAASCLCVSGYTGLHCDTDIDECVIHKPCQNGATCANTPGNYSCQCSAGFEGNTCQIDIDECATTNVPCENGATCVNTFGSYKCECISGYEGQHCQTASNVETNHGFQRTIPCQHGATCKNTVGSYTCMCNIGYIGQLCNIDIDECSINDPCLHGATCINTPGSYMCQCAQGFEGNNCQTDINECATGSPCIHGTCIDTMGSYSCQCYPGYQGRHCQAEINECISLPCQNGGVCFDGNNDYTCDCNAGFTGKNCENDVDECIPSPCQHGATCIDGVNTYTCQCAAGYIGNLCSTEVDECASHPCQHGGTCTDLLNDYNCTCKDMVVGKDCQTDLCADVAPNCAEMFGVCLDYLKKTTICRGTCGVCGSAQIVFAGQTLPTTAVTLCQDVLPNCGDIWGVCRDHAMAERNCRKTCGACGTSEVVFG